MSYDESYFHDPDQPWMPRLIDIEAFKQSDDANKAAYYGQFGFNQIDHNTVQFATEDDISQVGLATYVETFGNDTDTEYTITHNFDTYDLLFNVRTTAEPVTYVNVNVAAVSTNAIKVMLVEAPGTDALSITIMPSNMAPTSAPYPNINQRWNTLVTRFNQKYYYRMIGIETLEHWQNNLQERFDQVAPQFELAYSLMSEHNSAIVDDVIGGETETIVETNQASGSDTSTGTSKNWDTPDTAINANASYADSVGTSDGSTTYGRLDTHNITRTRLITGEGILNNINATIRNFRDIDTWFIEQFEPLFLSVYWY